MNNFTSLLIEVAENNEGFYWVVMDLMAQIRKDYADLDLDEQAQIFADVLEDLIYERKREVEKGLGLLMDALLSYAIQEVNFYEVALYFLTDGGG